MFRSMLSEAALLVSNVVTIMFYCNKCLLNGLATDSEIHYLKANYPQVFYSRTRIAETAVAMLMVTRIRKVCNPS